MNKYLIVDANNICWRVFHATNGKFSLNTNVLFGFFSSIFHYQKLTGTDRFIFCWDKGEPLRKKLYPNYKIHRLAKRAEDYERGLEECHKQISLLRDEILDYIGFRNNFSKDGYEADDLIASVVKRLDGSGTILSSDKDLYQLLDDNINMWLPHAQRGYDQLDFRGEYGISHSRWWRVKALAGCSTDNVIGVDDVGEVTAIRYLKKLLTKGKRYVEICKQEEDLLTKNKPLVRLPFKGTPKLKIREDELSRERWNKVMDHFLIKRIKLLYPQ